MQQNKLDDAEAVLTTLKGKISSRELAAFVPADLRRQLFDPDRFWAIDLVIFDAGMLRRQEMLLSLAKLLQDRRAWVAKIMLARNLAFVGQEKRALDLSMECFEACDVEAGRWYAWLMQRQGKALEGLERVNIAIALRKTEGATDSRGLDKTELCSFVLSRAHLLAALNRWDDVETTLEEFQRFTESHPTRIYRLFGNAWLMAGFCRERRGDHPGAIEAWEKGLYKNYLKRLPEYQRAEFPGMPDGSSFLMHSILSSLTGDLSDAEAQRMFQHLLATFGSESWLSQVATTVRFSPEVFRTMWLSPRGKEYARKIAFLEPSYGDCARAPLLVTMAEKIRLEVFKGNVSSEQEDVIWNGLGLGMQRFYEGKLGKTQVFQLALAWKGTTNFLGWGGVALKLEPSLRAPAAYILGHRYLTLNRRDDALMFFRTALKDAASESTLRTLAEREIARLEKKR